MGVTLLDELPFAHVVTAELADKVCANCMKPYWHRSAEKPLSRCSKCKFAYYCDRNCQRGDFLDHKAECSFLLHISPTVLESMPRLVGRIIAKLRRADGQKQAFNGRSFSSLQSNIDEIRKDDERRDSFLSCIELIENYLPEMPSKQEVFEIFCKVVTNGIGITDSCFLPLGVGIYLGLSALNHSCNPELYVIFNGKKAILKSFHNHIRKYSDKLHIQYCDTSDPGPVRRERLKAKFYFVCNCELCQDVESDKKKYSLRCSKCKDGYCPYNPEEKENQLTQCEICGELHQVIVDEVQDLCRQLTDIESLGNQLDKLIDLYSRCRLVFSRYNADLCRLTQTIVFSAVREKRYNAAAKYAEKTLAFYRAYYPKGHPCLTAKVYEFAKVLMLQGNPLCFALLQEALELACESHGRESGFPSEISYQLWKLKQKRRA